MPPIFSLILSVSSLILGLTSSAYTCVEMIVLWPNTFLQGFQWHSLCQGKGREGNDVPCK